MNRFSLYILLVLVYLGISKSYSPHEVGTVYLENEKLYSSFFPGAPITVVLQDSFEKGFLIKTYYHRYLVFDVFSGPENIVVRTSKKFWKNNLENQGMSLFSRRESDFSEILIPTIPGFIFIGDPSYGHWESNGKGQKIWSFHRPYRHFPKVLYWGDFMPTDNLYKEIQSFVFQDLIYKGPNEEFGTKGLVTQNQLKDYHGRIRKIQTRFWEHFKSLWKVPVMEGKSPL